MIQNLYQSSNTIWPSHLRRKHLSPHDEYDLADALRACKRFNDYSPMIIVDGKDTTLVYAPGRFETIQNGQVEVVFHRNDERSDDTESWYDVELQILLGNISQGFGTHRLVLAVNGLLTRPYEGNEWLKFRTGPHRDGMVLHFHLAYDESLPRLLKWEQAALDKIEAIDQALTHYTVSYNDQRITVTELRPKSQEGLHDCCIVVDDHGASARVVLPSWFKVGVLQLGSPDAKKPHQTFQISLKRPAVILTPRNLRRDGVPPNQPLEVRIHPEDYVMFYD